ncbi:MAG TPA: serpin family protein [Polyangiaceae bacterium]|jgi:serpin B
MSGSASLFASLALSLALIGCAETKRSPALGSSEPRPERPATPTPAPTTAVSVNAAAKANPGSVAPTRLVLSGGAERVAANDVTAAEVEAVVRANNAFAVALFAQLRSSSKGQNLLSSPLSASLALTMTYAGAKAETAREIAAALQLGEGSSKAIFEGQNALSQALLRRGPAALAEAQTSPWRHETPAPNDFQLQVVNSIWGQADYPWETPFLRTLSENYGTGVTAVDFRDQLEPAREAINAWVSTETGDKIKDLLPRGTLDTSTRMVLVNALHLKLPWAKPFSASDTDSAVFTRGDGKKSSTRFMHLQGKFDYRDDGAAQIISLPLSGQQLTVLIALPHAGTSLASYQRTLRAGSVALKTPKDDALVALSLPKASFTSETFSLALALKALGVKRAFDGVKADFSGMCSHIPDGFNLYLSDVWQKTMIAIQETGVEAAAATAVGVAVAASAPAHRLPPPVPIPMIVNRPYLISVVDQPTGAILLLGQINDPSDGGSP